MRSIILIALAVLAACTPDYQPPVPEGGGEAASAAPAQGIAILAGGCFWCTEADFEKVPGVQAAVSGYTGGSLTNPTYQQVSAGGTGHYEAVRIRYDPAKVGYAELARYFFRTVDPVDAGGQFCDRGSHYRSAIFAETEEQRRLAEVSKETLARSGRLNKPIVTEIAQAGPFYQAEEYHQDYYHKNPVRYQYYRLGCGRDARLQQIWGKEPKT